MSHPTDERPADARHLLGSFIGMSGMACVLFLVLASGLVAPAWAVALLTLVWLVLFVLGSAGSCTTRGGWPPCRW